MLIDPFTVFVQVLNFLILVLILKRFLFRPITRAMAQREERLARELDEAQKAKEKAEQHLADIKARNARLKDEEARMLQEIKTRAATLEKELTASVKAAVRAREHAFIQSFEREKRRRIETLQQEMATQLFTVANTALHDLAGISLHASMVAHFLDMLEQDPGAHKDRFPNLFTGQDTLTVSTPFELTGETTNRLRAILDRDFGFSGRIVSHLDPGLLAGVSLSGNGHRLDWTIHRYLEDLKTGLLEQES
ncbi:F0F1 ATP synthase subunit B family protein [Desulfoplanes formicivorans]|uniref:ATP synthase subunit b n=1 Tax=Desulfoplanes formicivorans TaxID=1592317 RepID=A0A194AK75_9BACT|nr:F0F1 ATP synthase subunit delta [Desulfoplanes formicivorans]GAU09461.1 ATP synthase subunit B [Desulfoplanes formicivorans]